MSDLATVSAEIAPYLALAANSLGASVITAAQERIADHAVTAGEGFFRRLLHRGAPDEATGPDGTELGGGAAQPLLDVRRADALDQLLTRLDGEERQLLSAAVTAWLAGPADRRDAAHLVDHVSRLASATDIRIVHNTPTAYGQGSIAAGEIHGNITMGGGPAQDGV
ncbi:hypothetical protein ACH4GP_10805 [Streptomyces celluloflavus]|uniref:Uncharacterized protein n=1 Tax=Streptomyces celluloflavus TaxID=58344 RepID=A0ABW7R9X7_9ACTN